MLLLMCFQVYVADHTLTEALQDPNEVTYCEVSCIHVHVY